MEIDTSKWSGEGTFTQRLIDRLQKLDGLSLVRVEDAPASRSEADYNFISNEIFVAFATASGASPSGGWASSRVAHGRTRRLDVAGLERADGGARDRRARLLGRRDAAVPAVRAHRAALSDARLQARRAGRIYEVRRPAAF